MGEHQLRGAKIKVFVPGAPAVVPASAKRTRGTPNPLEPTAAQSMQQSPHVERTHMEPSIAGSSSSSSSSVLDQLPVAGAVITDRAVLDGSSALLAAAAAQAASIAGAPVAPPHEIHAASSSAAQAEAAAAAVAAASAAAAQAAPGVKRQKSGTAVPGPDKKEKERRLNRVGLSYRCGRCGQPKKGHVCTGQAGEGAEGEASGGGEGEGAKPAASTEAAPPEPQKKPSKKVKKDKEGKEKEGGWDLDSESIFKDIKSVLQTPASVVDTPPAGGKAGSSSNANGGKGASHVPWGPSRAGPQTAQRLVPTPPAVTVPLPAVHAAKPSGSKRRKKGQGDEEMPPPPTASSALAAEQKTALLEELHIAMQRPPSVITPEDGEQTRGGPSSINPAPSSLVSATDMFSPGQLMSHLLGTPTPAITPGLSPGTLNELGNMLQSPGAMLASARKAQEASGVDVPPAALETPGQS